MLISESSHGVLGHWLALEIIRTWIKRAHVDLDGDPAARPPVPPHIAVWRSVRAHGETKTERSRRTLALPTAAVQALRAWSGSQAGEQLAAGQGWQDTGLVFTNHLGAALDAGNVRKMFKRICAETGIGDGWTPRELRTTFVSLMSHQGVAIEEIARLVGHATTRTTEIVYRRELRPSSPPAPRSWTSSSAEARPLVPAREPLKACTSQPRISGYLARTHYLGPEGDGHPVALADITQCDNSSITSISDRRFRAQGDRLSVPCISVQIVRFRTACQRRRFQS
jgi:hypothetical protein